jgi:hypothetical protein
VGLGWVGIGEFVAFCEVKHLRDETLGDEEMGLAVIVDDRNQISDCVAHLVTPFLLEAAICYILNCLY